MYVPRLAVSRSRSFSLSFGRQFPSRIMASVQKQWEYPNTRRDDSVVEDYHGAKISDPYRWLEDPDSKETQEFVEAQNRLSIPYIDANPVKEKFLKRLTDLYNYPKTSCPRRRGKRYYHYHNTGLQNQKVLYSYENLADKPEVFLDPNLFSDDGTVALGSTAFSENGEYFAYGISKSGSDWQTIKILNVETQEYLEEQLEHMKFSSITWTHDHKGFFYGRYPVSDKSDGTETNANYNQMLYYHALGTPQSEDILCWKDPSHPDWSCGTEVTDDGEYVVLYIRESCDPSTKLFYCKLSDLPDGITGLKDQLPVVKVFDEFEASYDYIANDGKDFYFMTNHKAPREKMIRLNLDHPEPTNWVEIIPEHKTDLLDWCACVNKDKLVVCYLQDVKNVLYLHQLSDGSRITQFPLDVGTICGFSGRRQDSILFYDFTSFITPSTIYSCDLSKDGVEPKVHLETVISGITPAQYEVKQVFYESYDRTRIPMFLVHGKDIKLDGNNPVLLYGYGGFNISHKPGFSLSRLMFVQNFGGVFAVANLRGGGEYGKAWHKGGSLAKKQNVFDDFHAAAEFLVDNKYTNPKKIAIQGGSNGGLLVGACINQKPHLYQCGLAEVGVLDMLRFHKFTIGHAWVSDYGCSEKEEEFRWLVRYSPLHNVRKPTIPGVQYPSVLLCTADHDDRVVPLHSLKHIATLQHELRDHPDQTNPLMIRVTSKEGHGSGKPIKKTLESASERFSFLATSLDLEWIPA